MGSLLCFALVILMFAAHHYKVRRGGEKNRVFGGICADLAKRAGWAPMLVRVLAVFLLLAPATGPLTFFAYVFLWLSLNADV